MSKALNYIYNTGRFICTLRFESDTQHENIKHINIHITIINHPSTLIRIKYNKRQILFNYQREDEVENEKEEKIKDNRGRGKGRWRGRSARGYTVKVTRKREGVKEKRESKGEERETTLLVTVLFYLHRFNIHSYSITLDFNFSKYQQIARLRFN